MQLPFTHDQFLDVFGAYNRALWPAASLIWLLTAAAIVTLYRRGPRASRLVAAVLAFHWGWAGVAYHLAFFRSINPAATVFAAAFVLQAALFLWRGVLGSQLSFQPTSSFWGRAGGVLIGYSLLYPALGLALGLGYPRLPSFGVPCPTAILTAGLLLLAPRREVRLLSAIPLLWAGVGSSAAVLLDIHADLALAVAGLLLLLFAAVGPHRSDIRATCERLDIHSKAAGRAPSGIRRLRKAMLLIVTGLVAVVAAAVLYGELHWRSGTRVLRDRLEAARLPIEPKAFDRHELERVPAPVKRYFRAVLEDGQPIVAAVSVIHTGTFNMSEAGEQWKPFTSNQRVVTRRPGFDWDGRVAMLPGLRVHVHDAYVAGEGILHAAVMGLLSTVNLRGTDELARGELMRFFAEAAWYPTALLPSQGVRWDAVDDHSARATLKDGDITLTLLFHFNQDGLIDTVRAEARGRTVSGTVVPTPWYGRFWNYAIRDGMRVPLDGEVAWLLPDGAKPYWRGRITKLSYEFAQ